eukprot:TRINITY_DN23499_c0_g1_i1.p1 TRINITY_DN23499_c0_g1~~TRINITY_DN23499_c0_g1_i1.p1  ORF type:complete len:817 (+),score=105.50 TRINITY_DN23499_c0_g1_i1:121-2451(+)
MKPQINGGKISVAKEADAAPSSVIGDHTWIGVASGATLVPRAQLLEDSFVTELQAPCASQKQWVRETLRPGKSARESLKLGRRAGSPRSVASLSTSASLRESFRSTPASSVSQSSAVSRAGSSEGRFANASASHDAECRGNAERFRRASVPPVLLSSSGAPRDSCALQERRQSHQYAPVCSSASVAEEMMCTSNARSDRRLDESVFQRVNVHAGASPSSAAGEQHACASISPLEHSFGPVAGSGGVGSQSQEDAAQSTKEDHFQQRPVTSCSVDGNVEEDKASSLLKHASSSLRAVGEDSNTLLRLRESGTLIACGRVQHESSAVSSTQAWSQQIVDQGSERFSHYQSFLCNSTARKTQYEHEGVNWDQESKPVGFQLVDDAPCGKTWFEKFMSFQGRPCEPLEARVDDHSQTRHTTWEHPAFLPQERCDLATSHSSTCKKPVPRFSEASCFLSIASQNGSVNEDNFDDVRFQTVKTLTSEELVAQRGVARLESLVRPAEYLTSGTGKDHGLRGALSDVSDEQLRVYRRGFRQLLSCFEAFHDELELIVAVAASKERARLAATCRHMYVLVCEAQRRVENAFACTLLRKWIMAAGKRLGPQLFRSSLLERGTLPWHPIYVGCNVKLSCDGLTVAREVSTDPNFSLVFSAVPLGRCEITDVVSAEIELAIPKRRIGRFSIGVTRQDPNNARGQPPVQIELLPSCWLFECEFARRVQIRVPSGEQPLLFRDGVLCRASPHVFPANVPGEGPLWLVLQAPATTAKAAPRSRVELQAQSA